MPIVDMPIEQLMKYQGINPRPHDHTAYWETALTEIHALDPQAELIPSDFQTSYAECFHLYFKGVGGARVHAKYLRPRNSHGKHPAMLQFHGYSGSSGDWIDKLPYVAAGFCVAALDCRGQAGLSQDSGSVCGTTFHGHIIRGLDDAPEKLTFRSIFLDTAELANIIMQMPEVDPTRVASFGGSQGGALSLVCASLEPRIAHVVTLYPFLCDYKRVWEMDLFKDAYQEMSYFIRSMDPRHERIDEIFNKLGYIDVQYLTPRIRGEVWMITGLMDTICPPSTQFAAYNKITAPKHVTFYPNHGHEGLPDINDLVFQYLLEKLSV